MYDVKVVVNLRHPGCDHTQINCLQPGSVFGYRFRYAKENWPGAAAFVRQEQADAVIIAPGYLNLALDRYPRGAVRKIRTPADSSALPDLKGAQRVALLMSHSGQAQERLRAALDATYPASPKGFSPLRTVFAWSFTILLRARGFLRNLRTADE